MLPSNMRPALFILSLLATLVSVVVLGLVIGAFLDPTSSLLAVVGSMVWSTFGPFLLLAVLAAGLVGHGARSVGIQRLGKVVLVLSTLGMLGAGFILARIGLSATAAGAEIDVPSVFMLEAMNEPAPDVIETYRMVDGKELRAAVYLPAPNSTPAPAIAYIHGGGFMTGSYTETAADLRWFADRGWLVISLEYRLFGPDFPTWDRAPDDVACGLVWIHRNAARFGGDPTRIALLGDSAGGNLAINIGFGAATGRTASTCGEDVPAPSAIAVQYPAVDPMSIYEDGFPVPGFEPRMLIQGYIGGSPYRYPDRVAAISSATFLTRQAPPTLIILPEKDSLVVKRGTLAFAQEAELEGLDLDLVRIPFANHIFNQVAANSLGNQIGRTVRLRFLEDHVR